MNDLNLNSYRLVTGPSEEYLNQRQLLDYRDERRECLRWLLTYGKDPEKAEGYAEGTVRPRAARIDRFYRFVWNLTDGYTANLTHEHADKYMEYLAHQDLSGAHKSNCQKALQMFFKWRHHERGQELWEPEFRFSTDHSSQPRDYLTQEERGAIREAALEYKTVPSYNNLTPEERDRWKRYLAQRFEKPKEDVTPDDWDRANDWKIPSLVWTSLDTGLRPTEVKRSKISWLDLENSVLRIPKEESAKTREHWIVGLRDRTAECLRKWSQQRATYPQYDDTEAIWLTRFGNPYDVSPLRGLLQRLCDIAGIDTEHRKMSWYSIRHSVGTYMAREEGLAAAQAQLRHKSPQTTMKYDQVPVEDRQDALDRMG